MRHSTFKGEVEIDYVLRKSPNKSDILVVSFPGAGGDRFRADSLGLGYMMTIGQFNVNALYIKNSSKDFIRAWFVGFEGDFAIERAMIELVNFACEQTGATRCVGIGSSLGGNSVLYYGLKYNWDIISGGARAKKGYVGKLIREMIPTAKENGFNKHVYMCWGRGEPMWVDPNEAPSMVRIFDESNVPYKMELFNYSVHANISKMFPSIIKRELGALLGVKAAVENEQAAPTAAEITAEINTSIQDLKIHAGELEQTAPNYAIQNRLNHGDLSSSVMLRTFVYAAQGYHWLPGSSVPVRHEPGKFWQTAALLTGDYASAMWFQSTILNYYKATGDAGALRVVADSIAEFLQLPVPAKEAKSEAKKWWSTQRRAQALIDFACIVHERDPEASAGDLDQLRLDVIKKIDWARLRAEIIVALTRSVGAEALLTDVKQSYSRLYFLLLAAVVFKENEAFYAETYDRVMKAAVTLTNYYFDDNGLCIYEQVQGHHDALRYLRQIVDFAEANGFKVNPDFRKIKRKLGAIETAAAYLTNEDGVMPNLGHSDLAKTTTAPASGNLIKTSSNIAVLSGGGAYITIGGGSNVHSSYRHCDLLSFTFRYDGKQLVWDAGGGKDGLADYARSAVAHSALFCDEIDYVTPDYADWTALDDAAEADEYVFVAGKHMLIDGVTLSRRWLWLKPNIIVIYDEAQSESEHLYTQNFLLPDLKFDDRKERQITFSVGKGATFSVTQLPIDGDFQLKKFFGDTNAAASEKTLRGSRVVGFRKLAKLTNLAYEKRAKSAKFITVLEAHSGKEGELVFGSANVANGMLNATASLGDKTISVSEKLDREVM
ncbi:heparinase II/III domain-containing protein [Roseomonas sp. F4]